MTIPFLHFFQRAKARLTASQEPSSQPQTQVTPFEKPSTERLRKTVMPNTTRVVLTTDALTAAAGSLSSPGTPTWPSGSPPAVVLALEPTLQRRISLELADIVSQIPKEYLKEDHTAESGRRISLQASEIEKGMATGKPTVSLASLYEQMPEIFSKPVEPSESTEVSLPLEKVLEQFNAARVREDQQRDPNVPQVETPFLQVTIEDTERFGTKVELLQGAALPPVKVEPASAKSISEAEPETVVRNKAVSPRPKRSTIPLTQPIPLAQPSPSPNETKRARTSLPPKPEKIPFNLPPNGAGASASERVPASSGPPVPPPPSEPTPGRLATKGRLPFKIAPPSDDLRPKLMLVPGVERKEEDSQSTEPEPESAAPPAAATPKPEPPRESTIGVPLLLVLETVPPFQIHGNVSDVPADARVEFPLSLIQPQLSSGRVAIAPQVFRELIPANFREFFVVDAAETPVLLPLQEVLKNLPGDALKMRGDQEQVAVGEIIETPFSIKAKEDAERFSTRTTSPEPAESQAPKVDIEESAEAKAEPKVSTESEEPAPAPAMKLDAKEVVSRAIALPGVMGCSITFSDGLIVAQKFPAEATVEALCAAAPSLRQRIEQHSRDTTLGALKSMTLQCEKSAMTFFMHDNICLTALHSADELNADTRAKLAEMAEQLTQTYAQPEAGHVDH